MVSAISSSRLHAVLAVLPTVAIVAAVYVGGTLWAAGLSFTKSSMLPRWTWAGTSQYEALLKSSAWQVAVENMLFFAIIFIPVTLALGYLLAALINRGIRGEALLRTIYLYPFALSFIVTGLVWRWVLDPTFGLTETFHRLGMTRVQVDWLAHPETALYAIILATVWHSAGLVMVILLAGLRGVDEDLWKALKIEGIPAWRAHIQVIVPTIATSFITATVLMSLAVVRLFDIVVAMTGGGPGISTEVPAKFIIDHLFERQQIGRASAAATLLLLMILSVAAVIFLTKMWKGRAR